MSTYRTRHAASNLTTVKDVERYVEEQTGERLSASTRNPRVLQTWRELGGLHARAFTEPQNVAGNWVMDRALCQRCAPPYERPHGRLPQIGMVCMRHRRWLGKERTQVDLADFGEAVVAERHWRRTLAPRGIVVECPLVLLADECARVGLSKSVLDQRAELVSVPSPDLLVYPETVRLARLLSRSSFIDAVLGDATSACKRAMVEREVETILPRAEDAEMWRALARVWDMVLGLQDAVRDARLLGTIPEDRWNVLPLWSGFAQFQGVGVTQVHPLV